MTYLEVFAKAFFDMLTWTWNSISFQVPWYTNYFWGLILISLLVWALEILFPWRKQQAIFRKDFFLDAYYMFFNFFLFAIFISGFYRLVEKVLEDMGLQLENFQLLHLERLPEWFELIVFFILLDFVQWFTHILLHRIPALWEFHKVHHSVKEMGFAAHLRYHWMENVLYKPLKTLVVVLIGGFEPTQAYIVHFLAILIGHLNHANLKLTYGPLKYIFNNPVMHLYHHAYKIPKGKFGINFGISLSLWDYLFGTQAIPEDSGNIELGFEGDNDFPADFLGQNSYGFINKKA
jgi:sterol desaturase/sphingolipid hydroxylase (fatty acid hydroxylase superfamily)